jgi:hypothetical protein
MIVSPVMLLAFAAMSLSAVSGPQGGDAINIPAALRNHLRTEAFTPIAIVHALPEAVRGALQGLFKETKLELADPGTPFQATDVVIGKPLPWRRMIAAGCSADHCVVYYERGGIAHVFNIVVFKMDGAAARFEFGGLASGGLAGLEAVKGALANGSVIGQTQYW